jgi:rubredoxin-NAD+ reductase
MAGQPLIVVGSGLAAWTTVREFRKLDSSSPVLMLCADSGDFYAKPSLSNAFAQGRGPQQLVTTAAAAMVQAQGVRMMASTRVTAIDTAARKVSTAAGDFGYRALVLATGAQPLRLPLQGDATDEVLAVNSLTDFAAFHERLHPAAHVLIIGAGLIGCEFANDLAANGYQVGVVDPAERPLSALLPEPAAESLRQALQALGVNWHLRNTVSRVDHDPAGKGLRLTLSGGASIRADLVLSAVGVRPDTSLAQTGGLACERGIMVDALLQTSVAGIHALGDCAQYATGRWADASISAGRTMPYVLPIMSAARALAATLSGRPTEVQFALMPVAVKTPACPLIVAAPAPGTAGQWYGKEPGIWHFADATGRALGFVLAGRQTSRRAEMTRLMAV